MSKGLFITGTGTDLGKTYIAGLIVKKLADAKQSAAYYKAAMSGNDRRADGSLIPGDALFVQKTAGIPSHWRRCVHMCMSMPTLRIWHQESKVIRYRWMW